MANTAVLLQQKLNAANYPSGTGRVQISGTWTIDRPIRWPSGVGLSLLGASMHHTLLRWVGPPDVPMFIRRDVRDSLISNFKVECVTPLLGLSEVGTEDATTPGRVVTTGNQTKRIFIQGNGHLGYYQQYGGVGFDGFVYPDANNEKNLDEDICANNMQYGILYNGHQCKANHIVRCDFQGGSTGVNGIKQMGGAFITSIIFGSGFSGAFFDIGNQTDTLIIDYANVESSARLYHSHGPNASAPTTGSAQQVLIRGGRFMTDQLKPDDKGHPSAIWCQDGGIKRVSGIQLGLGAQPIPMISIDTFNCIFDAHGIDFGAYGSSPGNSFWSGGEPMFDIGINSYRRPDGDVYNVRGIPGVTGQAEMAIKRSRKKVAKKVAKKR